MYTDCSVGILWICIDLGFNMIELLMLLSVDQTYMPQVVLSIQISNLNFLLVFRRSVTVTPSKIQRIHPNHR